MQFWKQLNLEKLKSQSLLLTVAHLEPGQYVMAMIGFNTLLNDYNDGAFSWRSFF